MIRRIKIKNYRSLNVDFKLDPVTVLIGRSGTGKTNFVEALRFLRQAIQSGIEINNVFSLTKDEIKVEYEIEFDVPPLFDEFYYGLTIEKNPRVCDKPPHCFIAREVFRINNDILLDTYLDTFSFLALKQTLESNDKITESNKGFLEQGNLQLTNSAFSSFQGNQKVAIARIALTQGLACYDFPGSVCGNANNNIQQKIDGLSDHAENYSKVFNTISKDLTKLQSWNEINQALKNLNSSVKTISFNSQNEQEILVSHEFDGYTPPPFDISKESEGFRRFFAHLLAVYQNPPKQTLVFEEPERGIHPGALQSLAEILKTTPEEGRGQVILTTHSPQLLDHFEPESIRVVVMENGETKIGPIEQGQIEAIKEELLHPGELLTVTDAMMAREDSTEESGNAS